MLLAGQRFHIQPADTHRCQHGRGRNVHWSRPVALAQDGREARLLFLGVRRSPETEPSPMTLRKAAV